MIGRKHLVLKGRKWWFHRDIPAHLRPALGGRKTWVVNLQTGDILLAQQRREAAYTESVKAFRRAASGETVDHDPLTAMATTFRQERLEWEADPNAWAAKVGGPVESEEDAITWGEVTEAAADTIGREQGSEAREKFLDIAHRPLPLDHFVEAHLRDSGLPVRTRQERRTAVKRLAAWRPALTLKTLGRRQAAEYVSEVLAKGNHKTGNKAISNLRLYWEAARIAGHVTGRDLDNPWIKQSVKVQRSDPHEEERGFTADEMQGRSKSNSASQNAPAI